MKLERVVTELAECKFSPHSHKRGSPALWAEIMTARSSNFPHFSFECPFPAIQIPIAHKGSMKPHIADLSVHPDLPPFGANMNEPDCVVSHKLHWLRSTSFR